MKPVLYKYLALHKKLDVPGIGHFAVEETPAVLQFTDKRMQPPASRIVFSPVVHPTNNHFYSFLSREWNVEKVIAIRRYKEEVENIMEALKKPGTYDMKGIGILSKKGDNINFSATESPESLFSVLPAERVMRKYAQHTVLVGEQEHLKDYVMPETTEETLPQQEEVKTDKWQLYALILAIVAVVMIVYYYAAK